MQKKFKEHIYSVTGMHCASCEVLIEQKIIAIDGIKAVDASTSKGRVLIEYEEGKPAIARLNKLFEKEGYTFSDKENAKPTKNGLFGSIVIAILIIGGFLILNRFGVSTLVNVNSTSSLPAFFLLGILAGVSSCAALVGGLILSMSKQWLSLYSEGQTTTKKLQPHIMFNLGRLASYLLFGAILGLIGSKFQISLRFTAFLIISISIVMVFIGLQMLGVKAFRKFQFSLPKSTSRYIANEKNFKGKNMPFLMGALTLFLPCGFTITTQGLALLSGNPLTGALMMGLFVLGTSLPLLAIGLSSIKFSGNPSIAKKFSQVAGVIILFFALFNINSQLNILGLYSLSDLQNKATATQTIDQKDLPPIVDGKQVIKMNASSRGYSPNKFTVRAGIPVRWEITDTGTSGCTNAVISQGLFSGQISLTPGETSIKEFTPTTPGKYKFSCWMGMISGVIEVVDSKTISSQAETALAAPDDTNIVSSGASGCGCGGGSGGTCGTK